MTIKVTLNNKVRLCDHCGAKNIHRTFEVNIRRGEKFHIGRICISKMTGIDTSGNPHNAADRLQTYLNSIEIDDVISLMHETD